MMCTKYYKSERIWIIAVLATIIALTARKAASTAIYTLVTYMIIERIIAI